LCRTRPGKGKALVRFDAKDENHLKFEGQAIEEPQKAAADTKVDVS
jgi:hypothetical protein